MRTMSFENQPRLCLFATQDIAAGMEIRFDYGVKSLWWRKTNKEWAKLLSLKVRFIVVLKY